MKTSELTGPALDWAVAKCEGRREPELINNFHVAWYTWGNVHYSTNWAHGGPIIEERSMSVTQHGGIWKASTLRQHAIKGPTPLIAAMRCFVDSQIGKEIDIPDELFRR
jgi:hypothetical protein